MADRRLRAVTAADVPVRAKSVSEAAKSGTVRELLEATRDRIAVAVENPNTPARDLAALTKRLLETVREIEALDAREDADNASSAADAVQDGLFDASAV
ncbi:hypothetical protein [Curtobacterium sp. MCBD17_030]|uniref:hypothetical protein n=1 Tax=Curtobacterium sp. MCBD17_030 TaxID=2175649 RepID=UPI001C64D32E|nr:hypothetical protein [Curtobacterium sp. MCBD17_030]